MPARTILVVEDEPHIALLLSSIARFCQAETVLATNGEQALYMAQKHTLQAALIDLTLPDVHGLQVGEKLLQTHPHLRGKIIYISGYEPTEEEEAQIEQHEARFLAKPFELMTIKKLLLELIQQ